MESQQQYGEIRNKEKQKTLDKRLKDFLGCECYQFKDSGPVCSKKCFAQQIYFYKELTSKDWSHLISLCLSSCQLNDYNVKKLMKIRMPQLKNLNLSNNIITDNGVIKLQKKQFPLKNINISFNLIKNIVLCLKIFNNLQKLNASFTKITSNSFLNLLNSNFKMPLILDLKQNKIGASGIKLLIKKDLSVMRQLDLSYCQIGPQGIKHLAKANWKSLQSLRISFFKNENQHSHLSSYSCKKLKYVKLNIESILSFNIMATNLPHKLFFKSISNSQLVERVFRSFQRFEEYDIFV